MKASLAVLTFAIIVVIISALIPTRLYSSGGYDPAGQEVISKKIKDECAPHGSGCEGECTYQDVVRYKCRVGTGDCETYEKNLGDPYAGTCKKTGSWVVNAILKAGACILQIGYECGGNCKCDKSST